MLAISLATPSLAALTGKNIQVLTGVEIFVDGVKINPTDANGDSVETFVYNGTTYVPLRAVSQSLGKNVNWDGANQRVYIGERPGEKEYLLKVCPPYQTDGFSYPTTVSMAGKKYANCMTGSWRNQDRAYFNLNGAYTTLRFDAGHMDGKSMSNASVLNIYLDGELSFSADLTGDMMPVHYDVPLYGALQMVIELTYPGECFGIGNIEIQ